MENGKGQLTSEQSVFNQKWQLLRLMVVFKDSDLF